MRRLCLPLSSALGASVSSEIDNSPVGWYVGSYVIRFIELESKNNENPEEKFLSWENTIIVKATSYEEAHEKLLAFAKETTEPYKGGPEGVPVQWVFEGVTELVPIYEQLEDGAEILWAENKPQKLKNIRSRVSKLNNKIIARLQSE
jgi:hypothetical protein